MPQIVPPEARRFIVCMRLPAPVRQELPSTEKAVLPLLLCTVPLASAGLPRTIDALLPPKPKALESTAVTGLLSAAATGFRFKAGSGSRQPVLAGIMLLLIHRTDTAALTAPAAPKVCPTAPLRDETGGRGDWPKRACTARASARSLSGVPVPCRLTYSISAACSPAAERACCMARRAPVRARSCGMIGIAAQANAENLGQRPCRRLCGSL